jgi:hypothetical protein
MSVARADMRRHIVSYENDHRASHRRYGLLQCWSRIEINICEIFGDVLFSTFATQSRDKRTLPGGGQILVAPETCGPAPVCTENLIRVDAVMESSKLAE